MPRMSKSAIDRLGKRLREADETTEEDLRALQEFVVQHSDPLASAVRIVREQLGLEPTHRLKTHHTLLEKLKRPPYIQLSRIQDIAGMRVVVPGTREDQDRVVEQICGAFEGAKITDRRKEPSYGYRAVHVILKVDGLNVEVQVRTVWQDRWAQIVERLGDTWGRQIRYGEPPQEPDGPLPPAVSRARVWAMVLKISDLIHQSEQEDVALADEDTRLSAHKARDRLLRDREESRASLDGIMDLLLSIVDELG